VSRSVLITGFHRSGTSAVARSFSGAGVDLGDRLLGAEPANPYGHFEDIAAIDLHDEILASEGLTWKSGERFKDRASASEAIANYVAERRATRSGTWGVKDPRMCLFLPEWVRSCPDAEVIFVIRPPGPTIASLLRRHVRRHVDTAGVDHSDLAFWRDPDLALKLWCHYHEQALPTLTNHAQTTVLDYAEADATDQQIRSVITRLGLEPDVAISLDRTLGQHDTALVHDKTLRDRAFAVWRRLMELRSHSR